MTEESVVQNLVENQRKPVLTARQVGVAAAFGGAALALVLAGVTIPIPGTPIVTDPREIFTTIGASLTGPVGGVVIGLLAGIAEPGIPLASLLAHVVGGVFNGLAYKNMSWRLPKKVSVWLPGRCRSFFIMSIVIPLFAAGLTLFYPDPEYGSFLAFLGAMKRVQYRK